MNGFKGIFVVTTTPFDRNGNFLFDASKDNLDYLISKGVHGLCIMGATGEYLNVTMDEHKTYIEAMMKHVAGRVPVIIGATRERPDDVIELVKHAKANGVSAAMVLSPYYSNPSQEEIYEHYKYINDSVDFPIMVYNNPGSAGVDIDDDNIAEISKLPNMKIIKESTGDIKRLTTIAMNMSDNIIPFCGCENIAYESFVMGAKGWICMLGNVAPGMCVDLYSSVVEEKDFAMGYEIYRKMLPFLNFLENFHKGSQTLKYISEKQGRIGGFSRRPKCELTEDEKRFIEESLDLKVLY